MRRRFIVVSGLPASGKSTLARAVANAVDLPFLDKDVFLESLFESRGIGGPDWRRELSRSADDQLIRRSRSLPAAVISSWWHHPASPSESGTPTEWLASLPGGVVEIHCACAPSVAAARFVSRKRHPGHLDGHYTYGALLARFQAEAALGPLTVGHTIEVDAEADSYLAAILSRIDSLLDE